MSKVLLCIVSFVLTQEISAMEAVKTAILEQNKEQADAPKRSAPPSLEVQAQRAPLQRNRSSQQIVTSAASEEKQPYAPDASLALSLESSVRDLSQTTNLIQQSKDVDPQNLEAYFKVFEEIAQKRSQKFNEMVEACRAIALKKQLNETEKNKALELHASLVIGSSSIISKARKAKSDLEAVLKQDMRQQLEKEENLRIREVAIQAYEQNMRELNESIKDLDVALRELGEKNPLQVPDQVLNAVPDRAPAIADNPLLQHINQPQRRKCTIL